MKNIYILILLMSFSGCSIIKIQRVGACIYVKGTPHKIIAINKSRTSEIGNGVIRGKIFSNKAGERISDIDTLISNNERFYRHLKTDENGFFEVELESGKYNFVFLNSSKPLKKK